MSVALVSAALLAWTSVVTVVSIVAVSRALRRRPRPRLRRSGALNDAAAPPSPTRDPVALNDAAAPPSPTRRPVALNDAAAPPSPTPDPVALNAATAPPSPTRRPGVLVVRPCAGGEPHLRRALESTAALRYRGPLRIVFSTSTADDDARPVMLDVARSLRARGMDVTVTTVPPRGSNLKSSQLAGLLDRADEQIGLVIDSDVALEGLDLDAMLAPMLAPRHDQPAPVDAVWCPPVEREPVSAGDRWSAALLGGSLHAFALLGALDPHGLVGKTFAVRLDALRRAGGFSGLVQHLGEDMELARRLRDGGGTIHMSEQTVASLAARRSLDQVVSRYTRWLMVIRAQRPALLASYPLLLAATPGLALATSLAWAHGVPGARESLVVALVVRLMVAVVARARAGRSTPSPLAVACDIVRADTLLLLAFSRAAFGPARVRWRHRWLRLGAGGLLERT